MALPKIKSPVAALDNILKIAGYIIALVAILKFAREQFAALDTEAQPVNNDSQPEIQTAPDSGTTGESSPGGNRKTRRG